MPFRPPNPPSGLSYLTNWCRRLQQAVLACRILPGRGYRTKYTSQGTILEIEAGAGGGRGNLRWAGEWDSDKGYTVGDLVQVTSFDDSLVGDGNNYTGIWLCTAPNDGEQPIYPYPATQYWVLLSMGIRELNVADQVDGSKKQLVACNDAYTPP